MMEWYPSWDLVYHYESKHHTQRRTNHNALNVNCPFHGPKYYLYLFYFFSFQSSIIFGNLHLILHQVIVAFGRLVAIFDLLGILYPHIWVLYDRNLSFL